MLQAFFGPIISLHSRPFYDIGLFGAPSGLFTLRNDSKHRAPNVLGLPSEPHRENTL